MLECRQSSTELIQPSTCKSCLDCVLVATEALTAHIQLSGQQTLIPLNLHTRFSLECSCQYGWALELEVVNYTNKSLTACPAQMKWTCRCGCDLQCSKWNRRASPIMHVHVLSERNRGKRSALWRCPRGFPRTHEHIHNQLKWHLKSPGAEAKHADNVSTIRIHSTTFEHLTLFHGK